MSLRDTAPVMSQENVDVIALVRRALEAYSRGEFDAAVKNFHSEVELVPAGGQHPLKGAARFRAWMEPDALEYQVVKPLDFHVVGNKVLVQLHSHIRGAGSGIETAFLAWSVWTFDEAGLITRLEIYLHHQKAEAIEAVGLSEHDAHADS
jgi:ketosteroid isomerase-like protein